MKRTAFRADWVLPVAAPPIRDGLVVIDEGKIESVGPYPGAPPAGLRVTDLGEAALMPGLVNVHCHPELTLLRGRLEVGSFAEWIDSLIALKYSLEPAALKVSTWLGVAEAIAAGVTCLAAPDDAGHLLDAMDACGLRGRVYREVFGPDPATADEAIAKLREQVDEMRNRAGERVEVGISPHAPYTVSARLLGMLAEYARAEALPVTIHVAESQAEERFIRFGDGPLAGRLKRRGIAVEPAGTSPVAWLERTGLLATRPLLAHCVGVSEKDVALIAEVGAAVAHCPISNAKFGHGVAPLSLLEEHGVAVGLGSDSVVSNNRVDILEEARAAALFQRAITGTAAEPSAERCLRLATVEGARALGMNDSIGTLEVGKRADLTAVRLDRPWSTPVGDPVAAVIHSARGSDVILTVVAGQTLYDRGNFMSLDFDALVAEAKQWERRRD